MNTAWTLVTGPTLEPLSLDEAKGQLRIDTDADDAGIVRRIRSARSQAETYTMRGFLPQTWKYAQDIFTNEILLPMAAPLQNDATADPSTAVIVRYYDAAGVLQTLATTYYQVDTLSEPGRILLAPLQVWPVTQANRALAVEITYVVGWTSAEEITPEIIDAICLLLGDSNEFRTNTVVGSVSELPNGVEALLAPHRRWWRPPVCA